MPADAPLSCLPSPLRPWVARFTGWCFCLVALLGCVSNTDPLVETTGPDGLPLLQHVYDFRATGPQLEIAKDRGPFRGFWPVGLEFSLTLPGTSPGEHLATREQIGRWLASAAEIGANTVEVDTIQTPEFYRELRAWNLHHQDQPLFLLQGVGTLEPADKDDLEGTGDYLHPEVLAWGRDEADKVVDVVHGKRVIAEPSPQNPLGYGRAYGVFDADVSPWLLGFAVGHDLEPGTAALSLAKHPEPALAVFAGSYLTTQGGNALEAMLAALADQVAGLEQQRYGEQHPLGIVNSPVLDPLSHPSEPLPPLSNADAVVLDPDRIAATAKLKAGLFTLYHVRPWEPNFLMYEPAYAAVSDDQGANPLLGYLTDLRARHASRPLLIGALGVPASQGCGRFAPSGLHFGGLDERAQGWADLRLLRTAVLAGVSGAVLRSAVDQWFNRSAASDALALPRGRQHLWYNALNPAQHFGLIGFAPGSQAQFHAIDGAEGDWTQQDAKVMKTTPAAEPLGDGLDAMRTLTALRLDSDAGYLHLLLQVKSLDPDGDGKVDWSKVDYAIALDTVDSDRGDRRLDPQGHVQVERRVEFQLRIHSDTDVQLLVDRPYDLFGIGQGVREPWQLYRSIANEAGEFHLVRWLSNPPVPPFAPAWVQEVGRLATGPQSLRSDSGFWFNIASGTLEVRIPWALLGVSDPSSKQVIDDDGSLPQQAATSTTPGIAAMAVAYGGSAENEQQLVDALPQPTPLAASSPGKQWLLPAAGAPVHSWQGWEKPPAYREFRKTSFYVLRDHLRGALPKTAQWPP